MSGSRPASDGPRRPATPPRNRRAWSCAAALFVRTGSRIEAALPLPGFLVAWLANTARDRANVNVAEIDVPAVLAFWILAAGEGGHGLLKRSRDASGKPLGLWCPERAKQKGRPKAASVFVGPRRPTANSTIADWHSARRRAAPLLSIPSVRSFHWHRIR